MTAVKPSHHSGAPTRGRARKTPREPPVNDRRITGGEAVYRVLANQGIDHVFGLLGGSMLELYDALFNGGRIRYIGCRDERAAGHMADAYARMSGRPGVALGAQAGPGVVNLATAVAEAALAYSPLVVIAGAISRPDQGKDTFQEIDQVAVFAPISKRSIMVTDPSRLVGMLQDAIRLSMSGRRGPVVLHVPRDIFAARVAAPAAAAVALPRPGPPTDAALAEMIALLENAHAPVIVAGGGIKWSGGGAHLLRLADRLQLPVVASTGHADVMPHGHPLNAGQAGPRGNPVASGLTREADLLLVLGARLGFNSTFHSHDYVSPAARIIQVDIEGSAIGRYFPVALGIQADAGETTESLARLVELRRPDPAGWRAWRAKFRRRQKQLERTRAAEAANDSRPMHPTRALAIIRRALPESAITTLDTGNACLQAADRLAHYRCPSLVTPLDFGLVGFGYAAALGASAACPGRPVVAVLGDGAFGFTASEINTAVRYRLPVIAVVLDNHAWGAEKAYQNTFFGGRLLGADIDSPRYDKVAALCGADGYYADTPEKLHAALTGALQKRQPAVIHAPIDPDALSALRKDLFTPPA